MHPASGRQHPMDMGEGGHDNISFIFQWVDWQYRACWTNIVVVAIGDTAARILLPALTFGKIKVDALSPGEGLAISELVCHARPIPSPTSCAASARPLPNNNPAPSFRRSPRTSACSPVRDKNVHDNAFRARTRERTSTGSAIEANPDRKSVV